MVRRSNTRQKKLPVTPLLELLGGGVGLSWGHFERLLSAARGFIKNNRQSKHTFMGLTAGLCKASAFRFGRGAPGPCNSATHGRRVRVPVASHSSGPTPKKKINLISWWADDPRIRY